MPNLNADKLPDLNSKKLKALFVPAIVVLVLDQLSKWWIRTSPEWHNTTIIDGWLQFYFTKNPGMAMGIDVLSTPVISVIAIVAVIGILIYILRNLEEANIGYLICMGLVLGGAFGNITDRLLIAIIMDYGGVLDGHVVDFIFFSLQINDWTVFPYIFNVADIAISCSILTLLVFNKHFFVHHDIPVEEEQTDTLSAENNTSKTSGE
jgi:signal peptidase II